MSVAPPSIRRSRSTSRSGGPARCGGSRCGRSGTSSSSPVPRRSERSPPLESVRDRDDDAAISSSGSRRRSALRRLRRVHHDRSRAREPSVHRANVVCVMESRHARPHLVQRPGVLEVCDPGEPCEPRDLARRVSRSVRLERRIDELARRTDPRADLDQPRSSAGNAVNFNTLVDGVASFPHPRAPNSGRRHRDQ